jgi:hypothetical protein
LAEAGAQRIPSWHCVTKHTLGLNLPLNKSKKVRGNVHNGKPVIENSKYRLRFELYSILLSDGKTYNHPEERHVIPMENHSLDHGQPDVCDCGGIDRRLRDDFTTRAYLC